MTDEPELVIRIATPDDMDELMKLAVAGCKDNGFLEPSIPRLAQDFWSATHLDHGLCAVIGPPGGGIEGMILLRIGTMWYSEAPVLEEKAIFIYPEFRSAKGGRAKKLCEFGKQTADKLGMPLIIGVLSNHRTEGKVKMYQRIFGAPAGAFFLYGAKTGSAQE
jgi:hypothetical protein